MKHQLFLMIVFSLFLGSCNSGFSEKDARKLIIAHGNYPRPIISSIPEKFPYDEFVRKGLYTEANVSQPLDNGPHPSFYMPQIDISIGPTYVLTNEGEKYVKGYYNGKPKFLLAFAEFDRIISIKENKETGYTDVTYSEKQMTTNSFGEILIPKLFPDFSWPQTANFEKSDGNWKLHTDTVEVLK